MAKSMEISGRYVFVDIAKVFGTFLVVFGHLLPLDNEARHFIYLFHMPFFFFVSGMLFRPSNFRCELYKDFRRILVPTFFFIALALVLPPWSNFKYESTQAMISIIGGVESRLTL